MSHFWVSIKLDSNRVNGSICSNGSLLLQVLFKWFISLLEIQLFFRFGFPVRVLTLSLYSSERPRIAWWACTGSHFYKSINFKILTIFWKIFSDVWFSILNTSNLRLISWFEIFSPTSHIGGYLNEIMPFTQPLICFFVL